MRLKCLLPIGMCLLFLGGGFARGDDLPADAQKLVARFESEAQEIQQRADRQIQERRARLINNLQALLEDYTSTGRTAEAQVLSDRIQQLKTGGIAAKPDPGALIDYRGHNGESFLFEVTGAANAGTVWGTDLYTDDSPLAEAAVHAGVLADGQKGIVKVTIQPGADAYQGSARNGVTTSDYGGWAGSYRVEAVTGKRAPGLTDAKPDPGNLTNLRGRNGESFLFEVTGAANAGTVWGTDLYTDDSALAAAAVHAGALRDGQKGVVKVTIQPGADAYQGTARNGVTTTDYGGWGGSYRVEAVAGRPRPGPGALKPDPGTLMSFRGRAGESFFFEVTGAANAGTVWGTDLYTDDSALAAAAVHAGVLADGQKGVVKVTIQPGADSYQGSTRNGVSSHNWDRWDGSYRVEAVKR